ncbi:hypothetical protein [Chryseobacterium luquanense]|uniref:Uncharacterized protein n=1 Tax=Chryseobacterium luquanense TaxID=2983766 RepID=A0ABT3Y237_9FLAO|nr:hypothetical protein [Chryseobacterium luquanense]MCX8532193.1 hypothetical protein [Chryseobacterium luquanense]
MKKIVFCIVLLSFSLTFAQNGGMVLTKSDFGEGTTFSGRINSQKSGRSLTYDEVVGSPYENVNFSLAKIAENYEKVPVRYNGYADQIEFQSDGKVMVLPKDSKFSRIEILSPKQTLVYLETADELSGYFYGIIDDKIGLYKKAKIKFIDAIPASNTYTSDKPALFKKLDPVFYIKVDNRFIKNPKNQKEIIAQFSDKKDELNIFFKENKIKFDNENDLKKLIVFLNNK